MSVPARKTTLLVVEDDPALRTFYRSALTIAGYAVVAVEDGVDALRRVEIDGPDLVILDMGLPRLGGLDVTAELKARAETRRVPIMVVRGDRNLRPESRRLCVRDAEARDGRGVDCSRREMFERPRLIPPGN